MKIAKIEPMIVNIPAAGADDRPVGRNGVTAALVRVETDTGLVGWGEGSVGANAESIYEEVRAAIPIAMGRNPWNTQAIADDFFEAGQWSSAWRPGGANYAYAGLDMALWDVCGQDCGQPLYHLFGGLRRPYVDYCCFVRHGPTESVVRQCREAMARGYRVFYTNVGVDLEDELRVVEAMRQSHTDLGDVVVVEPLPTRTSPRWGAPAGPGLGITVDEEKVAKYRRLFDKYGRYLPYQAHDLAHEERG